MRKAINEVRAECTRKKPLSYRQLQRLFESLDQKEKLQLVDYIITKYSVLDYKAAAKCFGGTENMLKSMEYNTGSEYEVQEQFTGKSDICYSRISYWLINRMHIEDVHRVFFLSLEERTELLFQAYRELGINLKQLSKFFRIRIQTENPTPCGREP